MKDYKEEKQMLLLHDLDLLIRNYRIINRGYNPKEIKNTRNRVRKFLNNIDNTIKNIGYKHAALYDIGNYSEGDNIMTTYFKKGSLILIKADPSYCLEDNQFNWNVFCGHMGNKKNEKELEELLDDSIKNSNCQPYEIFTKDKIKRL